MASALKGVILVHPTSGESSSREAAKHGGGMRALNSRSMPMDAISSRGRVFWGWFFLAIGSISFLCFVFAAVVSKSLPPSHSSILAAIQNDREPAYAFDRVVSNARES